MTDRAPVVAHDDGVLRLVCAANLLVAAWTEAPTVEQLRLVRERGHELERAHPRASAYLNGIVRGGNRFPAEVREEMEASARDRGMFTRGVAHLVLLPGWQGPAARAVVRGAIAIARAPAPNRVFATPEDAAAWLAERLGAPWCAEDVTRAWAEAARAS